MRREGDFDFPFSRLTLVVVRLRQPILLRCERIQNYWIVEGVVAAAGTVVREAVGGCTLVVHDDCDLLPGSRVMLSCTGYWPGVVGSTVIVQNRCDGACCSWSTHQIVDVPLLAVACLDSEVVLGMVKMVVAVDDIPDVAAAGNCCC